MRLAAGENERTRNARPASGAVTIAAVMKQERPYIIEWVAWHRSLGFEIMIADNGGSDGETDLLRRLADAGLISYLDVRHFRWAPQTLAYYAMFRRALKAGVTYLGFLDADEFFEPLSARIERGSGAALIRRLFGTTNAAVLAFNWMSFGSSNRREAGPEPVLERFTHSAPQEFLPNLHFKSFCDIRRCAQDLGRGAFGRLVLNAHGVITAASYYSHDGFDMKFDLDRFGLTQRVSWRNGRIRHYAVKSFSEYRDIKAARGSAAITREYYADYFAHLDRNEIRTPMDSGALALLSDTVREIEGQLSAAQARARARPAFLETARVSWEARPTLRAVLGKLR